MAAITSGEPQRRSEVLRAFLEGSLLDTFGAGALADPTFQQVVDEVHDTMRADGDLAAEADRLVDRLLDGLESGQTRAELEAAFPPRPAAGP
jgi:hypothetical protein